MLRYCNLYRSGGQTIRETLLSLSHAILFGKLGVSYIAYDVLEASPQTVVVDLIQSPACQVHQAKTYASEVNSPPINPTCRS